MLLNLLLVLSAVSPAWAGSTGNGDVYAAMIYVIALILGLLAAVIILFVMFFLCFRPYINREKEKSLRGSTARISYHSQVRQFELPWIDFWAEKLSNSCDAKKIHGDSLQSRERIRCFKKIKEFMLLSYIYFSYTSKSLNINNTNFMLQNGWQITKVIFRSNTAKVLLHMSNKLIFFVKLLLI